MRKNIHPKLRPLKITIGKDIFQTISTLNKDSLLMDVDFRKHPAWTGESLNVGDLTGKKVDAFKSKFAGLDFGS